MVANWGHRRTVELHDSPHSHEHSQTRCILYMSSSLSTAYFADHERIYFVSFADHERIYFVSSLSFFQHL